MKFRWATVTAVGPLRVRFDGDTTALPFEPDSLIDPLSLAVDDRVRCELSGRRVIIHGQAGGDPDTGWIALTPAAGYTGSGSPAYRVRGWEVVFRGQLGRVTGNVTSGDVLVTGFPFPPADQTWVVDVAGVGAAVTKVSVQTNGTIGVSSTPSSTTSYVRLEGIRYPLG